MLPAWLLRATEVATPGTPQKDSDDCDEITTHLFIHSLIHSANIHGVAVARQSASAGAARMPRAHLISPQSWVRNRSNSPGIVEAVRQTRRDREQGSCHCSHHKTSRRHRRLLVAGKGTEWKVKIFQGIHPCHCLTTAQNKSDCRPRHLLMDPRLHH